MKFNYIPYRRFVILLNIDDKKTYNLGRLMRRRDALKIAENFNRYMGYICAVIDSKKDKEIVGIAKKYLKKVFKDLPN